MLHPNSDSICYSVEIETKQDKINSINYDDSCMEKGEKRLPAGFGGLSSRRDSDESEKPASEVPMKFSEDSVRRAFAIKVFALVGCMMTVVVLMSSIPVISKGVKLFIRERVLLYYLGYALYLLSILPILCCRTVARAYPYNYVFMALASFGMGMMCMCINAYHETTATLTATLGTLLIVVGCGLAAAYAPCDMTGCAFMLGVVVVAIVVVIILIIVVIFTATINGAWMWLFYALVAVFVIVFSILLIREMQMILGGRRHEIGEEDYAYAACTMFVLVSQLFRCFLGLGGGN